MSRYTRVSDWDIWDWLRAAGATATVISSLGLISDRRLRGHLNNFSTAVGITTALIHLVAPARCQACGTRQVWIATGFGCPNGC